MHLEFLIRRTVAAHVVLGAEYPFDIGHYEPLGQFEGLRGPRGQGAHPQSTVSRLLTLSRTDCSDLRGDTPMTVQMDASARDCAIPVDSRP